MRIARAGVQGVLRAFLGRFVRRKEIPVNARKTAYKCLQGQKKTPGNDNIYHHSPAFIR